MDTAIHISTADWEQAVEVLLRQGWRPIYKYWGSDAGIDFDLILLKKKGEKVLMGWDPWEGGEIQAASPTLSFLENHLNSSWQRGTPAHLKPSIINPYLNNPLLRAWGYIVARINFAGW